MATPFCDAVFNALDSYPADCAGGDCPQRCAFPDASGKCPAPAARMAQINDALRRETDPAVRAVYYRQLAEFSAELWNQYGIDSSSVSWENIAARCRDSNGRRRARKSLAQVGYDWRARPVMFARAPDAESWLDKLEQLNVGSQPLLDVVDPYVPIYADRVLPPVLAFVAGALFLVFVFVMLFFSVRRLARPVEKVDVYYENPNDNSFEL